MKKLITTLLLTILAILPVAARTRVYHNANPLPAPARTILKEQFPKQDVNRVKVDSHALRGDQYEVTLSDGTEIEFGSKGEWIEVDCGHRAVPKYFVIPEIGDYVSKNYKGQRIIQIERASRSYEVELQNGLELRFDRSGKFLRVED